jgi:hypothetical protein
VTTLTNVVTVGVVSGTPVAAPARPPLPNDAGGTFYIPLALVHIAPNFGPTSTLQSGDIAEIAPVARLTRGLAGATIRPADVHFDASGAYLSAARIGDWGASGIRPPLAMPPSMAGGDSLVLALQLLDPNDRGWIADGAVIDHSVDWRNRLFRIHYQLRNANTTLAWTRTASPWPTMPSPFTTNPQPPQPLPQPNPQPRPPPSPSLRAEGWDFGQSFQDDGSTYAWFAGGAVFTADPTIASFMAANTRLAVYVDMATGALRLSVTGTPGVFAFLWMEATAPFNNA